MKLAMVGAYPDQVKLKFNADAANWVWSSVTADEKFPDVILSIASLPKAIRAFQNAPTFGIWYWNGINGSNISHAV